jgi:Helix-turn-helix domain
MSEILKEIVDTAEAARMTGLTVPGFMFHVRHGRVKPEGLFGRNLMFKRSVIEAWIEEREENKRRALKEAGRL